MNDIRMKGPKILYSNEEVEPGIRRYVLKHIQSLDKILINLERANYTVSGVKSRFCVIGLKIVGYIYDIEGRRFDIAKIIKILEWKKSENVSEAKIFIGICVYYRIQIEEFAIIAIPINFFISEKYSFCLKRRVKGSYISILEYSYYYAGSNCY